MSLVTTEPKNILKRLESPASQKNVATSLTFHLTMWILQNTWIEQEAIHLLAYTIPI